MTLPVDATVSGAFQATRHRGLRVAMVLQILTALAVMAWLGLTLPPMLASTLATAAAPILLIGLIYARVIGTRADRPWMAFAVFGLDAVCIGVLIATGPFASGPGIVAGPLVSGALLVALSTFALGSRLVVWTGIAMTLTWWGAWIWCVSGAEANPGTLFGAGAIAGTLALLAATAVLAVMIALVRRAIVEGEEAVEARRDVEGAFGRYLPEAIREEILETEGALEPTERDASAIFVDVAGFTLLAGDRAPGDAVQILDAFFTRASAIVGEAGGTIVAFVGDAFLATFNLPLATESYPDRALWVARALLHASRKEEFAGAKLELAIGIATGPIAAGAVGTDRPAFMVYGDTVNRAQRLQALNKELQSRILIDAETANGLSAESDLQAIGGVELRGREASVAIFGV
ncbi:adenylate/guanylate cyclase domain-containing protein [Amorphus sp. 3PC139-8]|uniref:adenylate/guanylate cyclase domain-containing protein n=1 Tax=Amorphus sp. 3PC139-8 TaxID=2735676 RepID=UPI00345CE628